MTSIRGQAFNFLLRHRHILRGQKKEAFDFNTSIQAFRDQCEKGARMLGKLPAGINVDSFSINGIPAEYISPENAKGSEVILYVHGGGYVSGSCNDHRAVVARIVKLSGIKSLQYEYRLAPEHPYPAALEDSLTVYNYLLNQVNEPSKIILAGESAGGGLALCLLLALKEKGIALPSKVVAISPWTDLKCTGDSYNTKSKVSLAPYNSWNVFSKYYSGENDPGCHFISPLYGDLSNLPTLMIYAGEDDELIDDSIRFAEKAQKAGTNVLLRTGKNMVHCYPLLPAFIPEARIAMDEIVRFIKNTS